MVGAFHALGIKFVDVLRARGLVRKHGLQDPKKKTNINADEKLLAVLDGRKQVTMFELTKFVNQHLV
jgi:chromatin remodeling complex protein RSC6